MKCLVRVTLFVSLLFLPTIAQGKFLTDCALHLVFAQRGVPSKIISEWERRSAEIEELLKTFQVVSPDQRDEIQLVPLSHPIEWNGLKKQDTDFIIDISGLDEERRQSLNRFIVWSQELQNNGQSFPLAGISRANADLRDLPRLDLSKANKDLKDLLLRGNIPGDLYFSVTKDTSKETLDEWLRGFDSYPVIFSFSKGSEGSRIVELRLLDGMTSELEWSLISAITRANFVTRVGRDSSAGGGE